MISYQTFHYIKVGMASNIQFPILNVLCKTLDNENLGSWFLLHKNGTTKDYIATRKRVEIEGKTLGNLRSSATPYSSLSMEKNLSWVLKALNGSKL